jgi:hypothetical protein
MYFARPVFPQPQKLDHEPLLSFFHFTAFTSDGRLVFSKSIFTPSERNREFLDMPFMNHIDIIYDEIYKIGRKSPDAEL